MKYLAILLMAITASASAASFDCKKAATLVEKEICSSEILGKLDDAVAENYKGSLRTNLGDGGLHLKKTQRQWLKERNSCKTPACIEEKYRERIDALCNDYPAISGVNWGCSVTNEDIH
jgi:uncharacterized protein